jgi:hypothetical protein
MRLEVASMEETSIAQTAQRIQGEYREMPGLSLTPEQARRLWGLDEVACVAILDVLVDLQFLRRTTRGSYVRRDAA